MLDYFTAQRSWSAAEQLGVVEVRVPTVLIVDDDADHRELMAFALRRHGQRVILAPDPDSGRSVLLGGGIDAVLVDLRMPGETGIEFCRRLRADPDTARLPAVLISAADLSEQRLAEAREAGADDFMVKPVRLQDLALRIDHLLQRHAEPGRRAPDAPDLPRHAASHPATTSTVI